MDGEVEVGAEAGGRLEHAEAGAPAIDVVAEQHDMDVETGSTPLADALAQDRQHGPQMIQVAVLVADREERRPLGDGARRRLRLARERHEAGLGLGRKGPDVRHGAIRLALLDDYTKLNLIRTPSRRKPWPAQGSA